MKNEDIDKLIKETLSEEEAKFYDKLDEQNLLGMIGGLYKGKNAWLVIIMHIMHIIVFGLLIYCIIQTTEVEKTNDLMLWIAGAFFCLVIMGMLKIFSWMQMHRNALMREIKRLELQVSSLSGRISE